MLIERRVLLCEKALILEGALAEECIALNFTVNCRYNNWALVNYKSALRKKFSCFFGSCRCLSMAAARVCMSLRKSSSAAESIKNLNETQTMDALAPFI